MTAFAFALVVLVVAALVLIVVLQQRTIDRQASEHRRLTQRILNALIAEDATEVAALNRLDVDPDTREFLERELRPEPRREPRGQGESLPIPHGLR